MNKNGPQGGKLRQVSGPERLRLKFPNANVVMMARIHGPLSEEQLKSATAKVRKRHPFLGVRVSLEKDQIGYFTSKGVPDIPVHVVPRATEDAWVRTAIEEHAKPFSYRVGPLIRLTLLTARECSDLIVTAHHAICDGLSLTYLVRDLLHHLADPGREAEPLPVPPLVDSSTMPASVPDSFLARVGTKLLNRIWKKKGITLDEQDCQDLNRTFWQQHRGHMLAWSLTKAQTSALISRCREENITVNTALVTAFVMAQKQIQEPHDYLSNVIVSVDFRERLTRPVDEAFAFYASAVRPRLEYRAGKPFWSTAREFHDRIKGLLTDENIFASQRLSDVAPSLLDALVFAKYDKLDDKLTNRLVKKMGIDDVSAGLIVTNLGRLDIAVDHGPLHLSAMYGPYVYSDTVEKYLGVMTVGGEMHLTLCSGHNVIAPDTVRSVRDAAMGHLERAVGC